MTRRVAVALALLVSALASAPPAAGTPGPPSAPEYWFDGWRIESLWGQGVRGQGVTIAEIDTGVNARLPELRGRIMAGHDFGERGDGQVDRDKRAFGHGTAMASIMVARPGLLGIAGLAPDAKILPLAVPLSDTTTASRADRVPAAIRYAADHHADIISMSLGGERRPGADRQPCNDGEQSAIFHALRKGALVIAAVGNTGPTENTIEDPAVCLGVLAVGAVDATGTVAAFSGRQPYLSLVAPGVNIPSLGRVEGQAYAGNGTSQATALTSATAALVWSAHPGLGARGVATRILATLDAHRTRPDAAYGYGLLDAYRAVTAAVPAGAPNPVFDAAAPFLSRIDALAKAPRKPPPAASRPIRGTGRYEVGTVPWLTPRIGIGIATAGCGLALLIVLLGAGMRARRRRAVPGAAVRAPLAEAPADLPPGPGHGPRVSREAAGPPDSGR